MSIWTYLLAVVFMIASFVGTLILLNDSSKVPLENFALNKPTRQSSYLKKYRSSPVDGQIAGRASFITRNQKNAWWQVDLLALKEVQEIRIYNAKNKYHKNAFHMNILFSQDGREWRTVYKNKGKPIGGKGLKKKPLFVKLGKHPDRLTKYVRLQLTKKGVFTLDEIMVMGH